MDTITRREFADEFDFFRKVADHEPVLIATDSGDPLVVVTMREYNRLLQLDRKVCLTKDLPPEVAQAIVDAAPSPEAEQFNDELEEAEETALISPIK